MQNTLQLRLHCHTLHGCLLNKLVLQIEDKDVPILSHLVDIRVVNLRDEEDVSTSNNDDDDDEEEEKPKVQALLDVFCVSLYVDTVVCCIPCSRYGNVVHDCFPVWRY